MMGQWERVKGYAWAGAFFTASAAGLAATIWLLFANVGLKRDLKATAGERDGMITWAEGLCDIAGASFKVDDRKLWGADCKQAVRELVKFRTDTLKATNGVLAARIMKDLEAARTDAARAAAERDKALAANERLRRARANVTVDQVGADYWSALNDSAGLRASDPSQAGGFVSGGGGDPTSDPG